MIGVQCSLGEWLDSGSQGDNKGIDNLPSYREWGKFIIYLFHFLRLWAELMVCSVLQVNILSISINLSISNYFLLALSSFFINFSYLNPYFYPPSSNSY